jgi:hypothetical protein
MRVLVTVKWNALSCWNCIVTNIMQMFLIYISLYFYLICFGLSFSPCSEAGLQLRQFFFWVWCQRPGADTIPRRLEPLPKLYTCLWTWAKRKSETCKAEVNWYINEKSVHYTILFQNARSLQHKISSLLYRRALERNLGSYYLFETYCLWLLERRCTTWRFE